MRTLVGALCVVLVGVWLVGCENGEGGKDWFGKEKPAAKEAPAKDASAKEAPKADKPAAKESVAKEAPKAEKPVAKEAPKTEKPSVKETDKPAAKPADKTAPIKDAAQDAAAKEAQPLLDKTSAAIKENKLDSAEESLKTLEGMKDKLPKSMQDQIGTLRKSLDAAKTLKGH